MSDRTEQITVRVTKETLERIKTLLAAAPRPFGRTLTKSDVVRDALRRGLDEIEQEKQNDN